MSMTDKTVWSGKTIILWPHLPDRRQLHTRMPIRQHHKQKKYAYTEGSLDGPTYRETVYGYAPDIDDPLTMEYADVWNDLMVSYGGLSITYDAIGNPLTYGTYSYTWNYRQLESIYQVSPYVNTTYKYNDEGIRTEKIDNGVA